MTSTFLEYCAAFKLDPDSAADKIVKEAFAAGYEAAKKGDVFVMRRGGVLTNALRGAMLAANKPDLAALLLSGTDDGEANG